MPAPEYVNSGRLSTNEKATIVSTSLGHKPYTRHRHTLDGTPSITHRDLASDRPIDKTVCLFASDNDEDD